jgi:hypothetical protein
VAATHEQSAAAVVRGLMDQVARSSGGFWPLSTFVPIIEWTTSGWPSRHRHGLRLMVVLVVRAAARSGGNGSATCVERLVLNWYDAAQEHYIGPDRDNTKGWSRALPS